MFESIVSKRRVFVLMGALSITLIGVVCGVSLYFSALIYAQTEEPTLVNEGLVFKNELRIPSLAEPIRENGKAVFDLTLQEGTTQFFAEKETDTWGVNGSYLGPTLRAKRGDDVLLRVTNRLGETTTIHWHGMHLPAVMDGGPHQPIAPGTTWMPHWTIDQPAATLWYHPHLMGKTAEHVYRGLGGLFILDDDRADSLALPDEYGVDDIPLIVQDRAFDGEGQLVYRPADSWIHGMGMFGDTILVNGTYAPYLNVPAKKVRLRLLNASNARRYNFGFEDDQTFYQIASDGGLLEEPVARTRVLLAPGERAEIIVDLSDTRAPVQLLSYAVVEDENVVQNLVEGLTGWDYDENEQFTILELRPQPTAQADPPLPPTLTTIDRWLEHDAVKTRRFVLGTSSINGKMMDMERIDEVVRLGDIEIWEITNPSATYHPFHVHDVQFQILDRDGDLPPPHERGWKDTVIVGQGETVRVIMRFTDYADPDMPYMYHCHILEHEDMGMMGQFVVIE